jgi:hypothetical protein
VVTIAFPFLADFTDFRPTFSTASNTSFSVSAEVIQRVNGRQVRDGQPGFSCHAAQIYAARVSLGCMVRCPLGFYWGFGMEGHLPHEVDLHETRKLAQPMTTTPLRECLEEFRCRWQRR